MADTAQNLVAAQSRTEKGKGPARRLREKGLIPAVVYGRQAEPTHLAVDPARGDEGHRHPAQVQHAPHPQGSSGGEKHVLFKDYQVDPVTRRLLHADFLEVTLDEPVRVEVPVVTVGKAERHRRGRHPLGLDPRDHGRGAARPASRCKIEVDVTPLKIGALDPHLRAEGARGLARSSTPPTTSSPSSPSPRRKRSSPSPPPSRAPRVPRLRPRVRLRARRRARLRPRARPPASRARQGARLRQGRLTAKGGKK